MKRYTIGTLLKMQILPVFLLLLSFWFVISNYNLLPDRVPYHFGPSGEPDEWRQKSWSSLLLLPLIQAGTYLLFAVITFISGMANDFMKYINLPVNKEKLTPEQVDTIRKVTLQGLWLMNLIIVGALTYMTYGTIQVSLGKWDGMSSIIVLLLTAGPLAATVWLIASIIKAAK